MRIQILALLLGTFLVSWGTAAGAGDLVVICNTSVSLKADEVRDGRCRRRDRPGRHAGKSLN